MKSKQGRIEVGRNRSLIQIVIFAPRIWLIEKPQWQHASSVGHGLK